VTLLRRSVRWSVLLLVLGACSDRAPDVEPVGQAEEITSQAVEAATVSADVPPEIRENMRCTFGIGPPCSARSENPRTLKVSRLPA